MVELDEVFHWMSALGRRQFRRGVVCGVGERGVLGEWYDTGAVRG